VKRGRKKGQPAPHPRCKICGSTEPRQTAEDAFPLWLRKRIFEWLRSLPPAFLPPDWEQGRKTLLKPVCQPCQRALNVRFEGPTSDLLKMMLDGTEVLLSPPQQALIAGWATKTSLVLRLKSAFDQELHGAIKDLRVQLRQLLKDRAPAANTTTRIAYFSDRLKASCGKLLPPGWPNALDHADTSSWFSVIAVPGFVSETITGPPHLIKSFIDMTKDDDRFLLLWPPHATPQRWPPSDLLSIYDIKILGDAWGEKWAGNFPEIEVPSRPPER
jgi:hypothetical protein